MMIYKSFHILFCVSTTYNNLILLRCLCIIFSVINKRKNLPTLKFTSLKIHQKYNNKVIHSKLVWLEKSDSCERMWCKLCREDELRLAVGITRCVYMTTPAYLSCINGVSLNNSRRWLCVVQEGNQFVTNGTSQYQIKELEDICEVGIHTRH